MHRPWSQQRFTSVQASLATDHGHDHQDDEQEGEEEAGEEEERT